MLYSSRQRLPLAYYKDFKEQWDALLPTDKAILSMIALNIPDLHGKAAMEKFAVDEFSLNFRRQR